MTIKNILSRRSFLARTVDAFVARGVVMATTIVGMGPTRLGVGALRPGSPVTAGATYPIGAVTVTWIALITVTRKVIHIIYHLERNHSRVLRSLNT